MSPPQDFGTIVACGMISTYNNDSAPSPSKLVRIVGKRLRIVGFIVSDHADAEAEFLRQMARWISTGRMKWRETIYEGIEQAVDAFPGLFAGRNTGKMLVKLGQPDSLAPIGLTAHVEVTILILK